MRLSRCAFCGRHSRPIRKTGGFVSDPMLESDRFPNLRLHATCSENMWEKARKEFGAAVLENPLMVELRAPWREIGATK